MLPDCTLNYTTRIETPYNVWYDIAAGKISGQDALFQRLYQVKGDFNLMMHWDQYFGVGNSSEKAIESSQPHDSGCQCSQTNMLLLLLPWTAFWISASINAFAGSLITLAVCLLTSLIFFKNKKTFYDSLSTVLVGSLCLLLLIGASINIVLILSYLAFGLMWSISCFFKIPLTAHYSMNHYGGLEALDNPLFVRTNRILTAAWGILYLLTPIWTILLLRTPLSSYVGAINSVMPMGMGIFTGWFQKWYPAHFAGGR